MFFDNLDQIPEIARKTNCVIFVLPPNTDLKLPSALFLEPEKDKKRISIDQTRDFIALTNTKQITEQFLVIRPADLLASDSQNTFLKSLEEPQENCHFVLVTEKPSLLLPTILSRSHLYFLKQDPNFNKPPEMDEETKRLAKLMIAGNINDLADIAENIQKLKDTSKRREKALELTAAGIELLYKSFFVTGKTTFVRRLPAFLSLYENLQKNGHIKLHLVADLVC